MRKPRPSEVTNALIATFLPNNATSEPTNETKYHDVVLQTADNHKVPALKAILAIRSPFFSRLFYGPFSESTAETVAVDLPQRSLTQVLHFIYSDEAPTLRRIDDAIRRARGGPKSRRKAWSALRCRDIETAVGVVAAADYCQINELAEWGCSLIVKAIRVKQGLACIALQAIVQRGGVCERLAEVQKVVLNYIVRYTPGCFAAPFDDESSPLAVRECFGYAGKCGLMHLGEDSIKLIFEKLEKNESEWLCSAVLFDALYFWGSGGKGLRAAKVGRENKRIVGADSRKTKDEKSGKSRENAKDEDQNEMGVNRATASDGKNIKDGHNAGGDHVRNGEMDKESTRWKAAMFCAEKMAAPTPVFMVTAVEPSGLLSQDVLLRFYRDVTLSAVVKTKEQNDDGVAPAEDGSDGVVVDEIGE